MSNLIDEETLARQRPVIAIAVTATLALLFLVGIGMFAWATQERQRHTEVLANAAAKKSVTANQKAVALTSKTTTLAEEERRAGALSIQNCERLNQYLANASEVRAEAASNAIGYATSSKSLSIAFAKRKWDDISQIYVERIRLDLQRAHIGRLAQKGLKSVIGIPCTLHLRDLR